MSPEIRKLLHADTGWGHEMGLRALRMEPEVVEFEWTVERRHLNPFGIVHGGVYSGVVETVCSVGGLVGLPPGKGIVGMENHTSFLRPAREGALLRAQGRPVHRGRNTQLWEASINDDAGRIIATGRVRLMTIDLQSAS